MRRTLRWLRRGFIVICLALCAGAIVLRLRTCRGSGVLEYIYPTGATRISLSNLISAPTGEILLDYGWAPGALGTPVPQFHNRMQLEQHTPGMDFDFDVGTMVIESLRKDLHTWWQFGFHAQVSNHQGEVLVLVPHWFLATLFGIPPLWSLLGLEIRALRTARRRRRGRCVKCGYDLRATPATCPECNTPPTERPSARSRLIWLATPLAAFGAAMILVWLGQCGSNLLWRKVNFDRWTLPTMQEYASWAMPYQPVVQAIYDYRAEHGALPGALADLTPRYLATVPAQVTLSGDLLDISTGLEGSGFDTSLLGPDPTARQFITYSFSPRDEGWKTCGDLAVGRLPLSVLSSTRPSLHGDDVTNLRLLEFDQRILAHPAASPVSPKRQSHQ